MPRGVRGTRLSSPSTAIMSGGWRSGIRAWSSVAMSRTQALPIRQTALIPITHAVSSSRSKHGIVRGRQGCVETQVVIRRSWQGVGRSDYDLAIMAATPRAVRRSRCSLPSPASCRRTTASAAAARRPSVQVRTHARDDLHRHLIFANDGNIIPNVASLSRVMACDKPPGYGPRRPTRYSPKGWKDGKP